VKLAEALSLRADTQAKLKQIEYRATSVARYQEGEEPPESAVDLLDQGRALADQLEHLIQAINLTNAATALNGGDAQAHEQTITDAIARRDVLASRRKLVSAVADAAANSGRGGYGFLRSSRSELVMKTDVDVITLRAEADDLSRQYRELDVKIQQANWNTELVE
jgi:uncharacterized protein DUF6847